MGKNESSAPVAVQRAQLLLPRERRFHQRTLLQVVLSLFMLAASLGMLFSHLESDPETLSSSPLAVTQQPDNQQLTPPGCVPVGLVKV